MSPSLERILAEQREARENVAAAPGDRGARLGVADWVMEEVLMEEVLTTPHHRTLAPFLSFYGSKYRMAPRYPKPEHSLLVEPFAGAAGYAVRHAHPHLRVVLYDKDPVIAGIWDYLIHVTEREMRALPVEFASTKDLPDWVPQEARWLMGFWITKAATRPRVTSNGKWNQASYPNSYFWGSRTRERIAGQLSAIRHWKVYNRSYQEAVHGEATYFVDPPYRDKGCYYRCGSSGIDYGELGEWCKGLAGQVIVCEQGGAGADWLPFRPLARVKALRLKYTEEVWWSNRWMEDGYAGAHGQLELECCSSRSPSVV
jgi:site-specific DNA-adenine methylase